MSAKIIPFPIIKKGIKKGEINFGIITGNFKYDYYNHILDWNNHYHQEAINNERKNSSSS